MLTYTEDDCKRFMAQIMQVTMNPALRVFENEYFGYDDWAEDATIVVDLGCGTGEWLFQTRSAFPLKHYVGYNLFACQANMPRACAPLDIRILDLTSECAPMKLEEDLPFGADYINCSYVLGHIGLPALKACADALMRAESTLVIETLRPKTMFVKEVLGYELHEPIEVYTAFKDYTVRHTDVYPHDEEPKFTSSFLAITDPQTQARVRAVATPVLYVIKKK